jgi:2-desacetyl-2-hydroxyethyl bacteriochlorophyllide A dehydrogenase
MKAIVYTQYGPPEVLQLREVAKPAPRDDQLLVKIHTTTVTAGDYRMRKPDPMLARLYNGLFKPKKVTILGFEFAGQIESVGSKVTQFKPGDRVFGHNGFLFGAYAEYLCLPANGMVAKIPDGVTDEQAAPIPVGATTALNILKQGGIKSGQKVLIYGASGSVGTYAVQLAKHFGAHVTAVCSTANVELVKSIGADAVIDYKQEDFTSRPERYDLVFDAVGKMKSKLPPSKFKQVLVPGGAHIHAEMNHKDTVEDLVFLIDLVASGKLKPVIDRRYPLDQVADAHRYVEQGHKKGNVIVNVQ